MCHVGPWGSAASLAVIPRFSTSPGVMLDPTRRLAASGQCQTQTDLPQTVYLPSGGQACRFCPSNPHRLAVATSQLFGVCGTGQLLVLDFDSDLEIKQPGMAPVEGETRQMPHVRQPTSFLQHVTGQQTCTTCLPGLPFSVRDDAALRTTRSTAMEDELLAGAAPASTLSNVCVTAVLTVEDAINDCAWSSKQDSVVAAACGDGSVRVWKLPSDNTSSEASADLSIVNTAAPESCTATHGAGLAAAAKIFAHQAEVCTVDWSPRHPHVLISASWDATARLWDILRPQQPLRSLRHPERVYAAQFSPHVAAVIASVSADGCLRIFDLHIPSRQVRKAALESNFLRSNLRAHASEALCVDWSRLNAFQIFAGAADGTVSAWDLRQFDSGPLLSVRAHSLAIRAMRCSLVDQATVATASYDTTIKIHYLTSSVSTQHGGDASSHGHTAAMCTSEHPACLWLPPHVSRDRAHSATTALSRYPLSTSYGARKTTILAHHTEFVLGLDWSPFCPHLLASTSWDRKLCLWNVSHSAGP